LVSLLVAQRKKPQLKQPQLLKLLLLLKHLLLTLLLKPHQLPMPLQHQQKHQLLSNFR
jgi:hypothetical protein